MGVARWTSTVYGNTFVRNSTWDVMRVKSEKDEAEADSTDRGSGRTLHHTGHSRSMLSEDTEVIFQHRSSGKGFYCRPDPLKRVHTPYAIQLLPPALLANSLFKS